MLAGGLANTACLPGQSWEQPTLTQAVTYMDPGAEGRRDGILQAYRILIASLNSIREGPVAMTATKWHSASMGWVGGVIGELWGQGSRGRHPHGTMGLDLF